MDWLAAHWRHGALLAALAAALLLLSRLEIRHVAATTVERLKAGDLVLEDRLTYLARLPYRTEVVDVGDGGRPEFARVVGISGDTIQGRRVPGYDILVEDKTMGDHGLVSVGRVRGRVLFVLYPLAHRGWLP